MMASLEYYTTDRKRICKLCGEWIKATFITFDL